MQNATIPAEETGVAAFIASMPDGYRERFDAVAMRDHAGIVSRRKGAAAHAEVWCALPYGGAIACVVADDRPGLLSLISAALVVHTLDVGAAQAYGRTTPLGTTEVVDFFWLQRSAAGGSPRVEPSEVASMGKLLDALLRGRVDLDAVVKLGALAERPARLEDATRIRFDRGSSKIVTELTIETPDRPGLLFAVTRALFNQRVQIVRSDVRTVSSRAQDKFDIVEFDGGRVTPARLDALEAELRHAIEALGKAPTG